MSRAKPLPPDERRRALIDVTLPLLLEHGPGVSTRQIAEAAGVAEGTIFRAFASKEDLVQACLTDALLHDGLAEAVARLAPDADLPTTVDHLARALAERARQVRTLVTLMHASLGGPDAPHRHPGPVPRTSSTDSPTCPRPDPQAGHDRVVATISAALEPHASALRIAPAAAASALVAFSFGANHGFAGDPILADPAILTDLILHGITKDA